MITTGISVACGYPEYPELFLEKLLKAGVKRVELFLNTHSEIQPDYIGILKALLDDYGAECISFHPFTCGIDTYMLYTGYARRVADYLDYHKNYFEAMNTLGAKYFILHGSKNPYPDEVICEAYMALSRTAKPYGITVLQENVARCITGDVAQLSRMKNILGDEVSFCLDIKQAIRYGQNPLDFVKALGSNIKHVHFSDHNSETDCIMPFAGEMDIPEFVGELKSAGFDGCVMTELYRRGYPDVPTLVEAVGKLEKLIACDLL